MNFFFFFFAACLSVKGGASKTGIAEETERGGRKEESNRGRQEETTGFPQSSPEFPWWVWSHEGSVFHQLDSTLNFKLTRFLNSFLSVYNIFKFISHFNHGIAFFLFSSHADDPREKERWERRERRERERLEGKDGKEKMDRDEKKELEAIKVCDKLLQPFCQPF